MDLSNAEYFGLYWLGTMYNLPQHVRTCELTSLHLLPWYAETIIRPYCTVAWVPAEFAGKHPGFTLRMFQSWAARKGVKVYYPRNLQYCILAHVPAEQMAVLEEYIVGLPCSYNQLNRESSVLYLDVRKQLPNAGIDTQQAFV